MIVETVIHYSKKDLAKKCWGCKFLEMYSDTDKSCVFKKDGDTDG